jgi:hypothetical protein
MEYLNVMDAYLPVLDGVLAVGVHRRADLCMCVCMHRVIEYRVM